MVLGSRGEAHPLAPHVLLPAPPGLQRDVMSAPGQLAAQRDDGKRVPRIAERTEQDPPVAQEASSAISRSCSSRSPFVNASGLTPSVPTPASR